MREGKELFVLGMRKFVNYFTLKDACKLKITRFLDGALFTELQNLSEHVKIHKRIMKRMNGLFHSKPDFFFSILWLLST